MVALCRPALTYDLPQSFFARKLSGFVDLPPEMASALDHLLERSRTVGPGTQLLAQGYRSERLSIVTDGLAIRYKLLADGRRAIVDFVVPGDIVGLRAHLFRNAFGSVETVGQCAICAIDPPELLGLFKTAPLSDSNVFLALALERTLLSERLATMARQTAYERLAYLFIELLDRLTAVGLAEDNSYDLPVTQEMIADAVGLSEVHVNRTLKRLRSEGLVTFKRPRVTIHDVEALSEAADSGNWDESGEAESMGAWAQKPFLIADGNRRAGAPRNAASEHPRRLRRLDLNAG